MRKIRIFLSSAQHNDELAAERAAIKTLFVSDAFIQRLFDLILIENKASGEPILNRCLREAGSSRFLLLILGKTLREPVRREYQEAIRNNVEVLPFIKSCEKDKNMSEFIKDYIYKDHTVTTFGNYEDLSVKVRDNIEEITSELLSTPSQPLLPEKQDVAGTESISDTRYKIFDIKTPSSRVRFYDNRELIRMGESEGLIDLTGEDLLLLAFELHNKTINFAETLKYLELAELRDPNNWMILSNLGVFYSSMGLYLLSLSVYERCIAIRDDIPAVFNNIANLYLQLGVDDKAIYYFLKVLEIEPRRYKTLIEIADVYLKNGEYKNAVKYASIAREEKDSDVLLTIVFLSALRSGNGEQAHELLDLIDSNSSYKDHCFLELFQREKKAAEYFTLFEIMDQEGGISKEQAIRSLELRVQHMGEQSALQYIEVLKIKFALNEFDYNNIAFTLSTCNIENDLIPELYEKSISLNHSILAFYHNLQAFYGEKRKFDLAMDACNRALEIYPSDRKSIRNKA